MNDRVTKETVEKRCANVNRRLEGRGSGYRYEVNYRSGTTALDRIRVSDGATIDLVTLGTKREISEALWFMVNALDDASRKS